MNNVFHLAVEGGDLKITLPFYTDMLGCTLGPNEDGKWQDIDFWGNELTLHSSEPRQTKSVDRQRHDVDMGAVCIPHFGIHLPWDIYIKVKKSVENSVGFLDTPYIRFEGKDTQQETFFVEDPNFNVLEIKSIQGTFYK
jgi:hypothetical protein